MQNNIFGVVPVSRAIALLLTGTVVGIAVIVGGYCYVKYKHGKPIDIYKGDGDIEIIGTPLLSPGYLIQFPAFDLQSPFAQTFILEKIPDIGSDLYFAIEILVPDEVQLTDSTGMLHMQVSGSRSGKLFDVNEPIGRWRVSHLYVKGGVQRYRLFFNTEGFHSKVASGAIDNESLELSISFKPGESQIRGIGVPNVRVGGFK